MTPNRQYLKRNQKFGIALPKSVKEAEALDKANGNTCWMDALAKEMKNTKVAFKILPEGDMAPRDCQFVRCRIVWDDKIEDFRRKDMLVGGGHMTIAPAASTCASVVTRETVRVALTLAALNDLEVKVGGVENAYIIASVREKIWTILEDLNMGETRARKSQLCVPFMV